MKAILIQNTWTKSERLYPEVFYSEIALNDKLNELKAKCSKTGNIPNNEFKVIMAGKNY